MSERIRPFQAADEADVIALWQACGLIRRWNDPARDIQRKQSVQPELFLVGESDGSIISSAMGGYDGHRGWVNYLAVSPHAQGRGHGTRIMRSLEQALTTMGCPKLNLQIRAENETVRKFYASLGYQVDPVISMGLRLIAD